MAQEYDKLVRDRIPEIIRRNGDECEIEVMGEADYRRALRRKLIEEATEAAEAAPDRLRTELADLWEVLDALLTVEGIERASVLAEQERRRAERGGLGGRLRLVAVQRR